MPVEVKEQEDQSSEIEKLKKELEKSREQTVGVKQKAQTDAQKQAQRVEQRKIRWLILKQENHYYKLVLFINI